MERTKYESLVQDRSYFRYVLGLLNRWISNMRYERRRRQARKNGAIVGQSVVMTDNLGRAINGNFEIGDHTSLHNVHFSSYLHKVKIGEQVIIGDGVKIVRGSHNIDSPDFENYVPNDMLEIEDYVWLCPDSVILPSVKKIGYGAVVGANAVVVKDVEPMSVVSGNPAKEIKKRSVVHRDLVVESLLGGDYHAYKQAWKRRQK